MKIIMILIDSFVKKATIYNKVVKDRICHLTKRIFSKFLFSRKNQLLDDSSMAKIQEEGGWSNGYKIFHLLKVEQDYLKNYRKLFPLNKTVIA